MLGSGTVRRDFSVFGSAELQALGRSAERPPDPEHASSQIDIGPVQGEGFTATQSCREQQAEQASRRSPRMAVSKR